MYPAANTQIKNPIPQTTDSITAVSGSIQAPASALKRPALIQSNQCAPCPTMGLAPCASLIVASSSPIDRKAVAPTPIQIGQCECPLSHRGPKNPELNAPTSVSGGIKKE